MLIGRALMAAPPGVDQGHVTTVVKADARTGRLVRAVVVALERGDADSADLEKLIDRISAEQGVESPLVHSVIRAESNYNQAAVSPKGAQGIMQLIPATARRFGVSDAFNAQENIEGGVRYLRFLLDYYQGDYLKAVAAYNAGEKAVDRYHGVPPYAETQKYVSRVGRNLVNAREKKAQKPTNVVENRKADQAGETPRPIVASVGPDGLTYYKTSNP
jgi:soluble lytic murein transglycosylase-like protein